MRQGRRTSCPRRRSFCSAAARVGPSSSLTSLVVMGFICDKAGLSPFSKVLIRSGNVVTDVQTCKAVNQYYLRQYYWNAGALPDLQSHNITGYFNTVTSACTRFIEQALKGYVSPFTGVCGNEAFYPTFQGNVLHKASTIEFNNTLALVGRSCRRLCIALLVQS
jgi:hypothetical protein